MAPCTRILSEYRQDWYIIVARYNCWFNNTTYQYVNDMSYELSHICHSNIHNYKSRLSRINTTATPVWPGWLVWLVCLVCVTTATPVWPGWLVWLVWIVRVTMHCHTSVTRVAATGWSTTTLWPGWLVWLVWLVCVTTATPLPHQCDQGG